MKSINRFFLCTALIIFVAGQYGYAQTDSEDQYKVEFSKRNLGGPRLGITYLPGNTELVEKLGDHEVGRTLSQFG
ncbi:MAG: hypothetical protein P8Y60_15115, partial [Calditrichota bacterium]